MPWHVAKSSECPASRPWAVIKDSDGSIEGCHASKDKANAQMSALYANEGSTMTTETPAVERFYAVAPIEMVDVRDSSATDDNTWTMSGYAAVFGQQAEVFTSKFTRATVEIEPKAFNRVLAEQPFDQPSGVVHFNRGHDMNTSVAATDVPSGRPGSLQLSADKNGLRFLAKVARDDPDGIALASKMRAGVVRQASFAFTTRNDQWTFTENEDGPDEEHRLITEMEHIYDVCAAPQGLFPQTVSALRSYATLLGQPDQGGHHRQPGLGGDSAVSPSEGSAASRRSESPLVLELKRYMREERERLDYVFEKEKDDGGSNPND